MKNIINNYFYHCFFDCIYLLKGQKGSCFTVFVSRFKTICKKYFHIKIYSNFIVEQSHGPSKYD